MNSYRQASLRQVVGRSTIVDRLSPRSIKLRYMLNLNLLKTLLAIVDVGTFSAAAEKLGLRQPTISLQIRNLEDSLAVKILMRRGKGVEVTPEGEIIVRKGRELIAFCDKVEAEIFAELQRRKQQIRVGAGPIMTDHVIPHIVARFQQKHPGFDVQVEPAETAAIVKGVLDHTYDVGFIGFPLRCERLDLEEWIKDDLILIVPSRHPFAGRKSVQLSELKRQNFIWHGNSSGIRMFVQEEFAKKGFDISGKSVNSSEVSSTMSLLSSVSAGLGLAVIPRYSAKDAIEMGMVSSVRIKEVSLVRKLYIATPKLDRKSAVVEEFIAAARAYTE